MSLLEQNPALPSADSPKTGQIALKGFFAIAGEWGLSEKEQLNLLGGPSRSTYYRYKRLPRVKLPRDLLARISYVMGIYKALQLLFERPEQANAWLRKPNQAAPFNGQSALDRMLAGQVTDLAAVREYLDAQRGW